MLRVRLDVPVPAPASLRVEGDPFHYLARVHRVEAGRTLEVFDGTGRAFEARVTEVSLEPAFLTLALHERPPSAEPGRRHLTLIQGLPKGERFELALQKATELGADAFRPVYTRRTIVKVPEGKTESRTGRWAKIVEEAARQSGRSDVPAVFPAAPLKTAVEAALAEGATLLVLDEEERARRLREAFEAMAPGNDARAPLALIVGPEGGLERDEVEWLVSQGATPVSLGRQVLRTETAAILAIGLARHLDGELG